MHEKVSFNEGLKYRKTFQCQIGKQMIILQVSGAAREERYE
jgi:hypothetical protein